MDTRLVITRHRSQTEHSEPVGALHHAPDGTIALKYQQTYGLSPRATRILVLLVLAVFAMVGSRVNAQSTVGIQPLGTYQTSPIDTISMFDLGVHLSIPLYVHKGRGATNGVQAILRYDTPSYPVFSGFGTETTIGWTLSISTATSGVLQITDASSGDCSGLGSDGYYHVGNYDQYTYAFVDATGYTHLFNGYSTVANNCAAGWSTTSLNESAADGAGYLLSATGPQAVVTDVSGIRYVIANSTATPTIIDTNGNVGYVDTNANTTYTDDSGVSISFTGGLLHYDQNGYLASQDPLQLTYTDASGSPETVTVNYKVYAVWDGSSSGNVSLVDSIVYPDSSSYQFAYQQSSCNGAYSAGLIGSITLPTGGTISYQNSPSPSCVYGPTTLTRTTSDGSTTYSYVINARDPNTTHTSQTTTTVSYADGSNETIHFIYPMLYLASNPDTTWVSLETAHTWNNASGTSMKSTMKCYNGTSGDCTTTAVNLPVTQILTTTTMSSGLSSMTFELKDASGLTTELDEYDYSASTPIRKTSTVYASLGNNIVNRPYTVTVKDGASNILSQKTYGYDEYGLAPSGVSGLSAQSGSRGNVTTIQESVSSSQSVATHMHYDDAGQVVSTIDGNGNTTTIGHDSTDTYVTSKTYPAVAGGTFSEFYTVDPSTGLVVQSKDFNGRVTAYSYDSMLRKSGICDPDGGYTQIRYPSAAEQTVSKLLGSGSGCTPGSGVPSGSWGTTTTQYDGYGRISHVTDPVGAVIDTNYDSMGRLYCQSNPHLSSSSPTDGSACFYYDALGRQVKKSNQDGSSEYWCYDGAADPTVKQPNCRSRVVSGSGEFVDYQDENGNDWQRTTDVLARLTSVAEPNGTNNTKNPSVETDYVYDALSNLTSVTQKGQSGDAARTRSFSYDSLSRLVSAANPESGTLSYTYDANGNVKTKTGAKTVVTTYTYDSLNRLLSKTYSNDTAGTPSSCYQYDSGGVTNGLGRLSVEWTQNGTCPSNAPGAGVWSERSVLAYDPVGRIWTESQCTNGSCNSSTPCSAGGGNRSYAYDFVGNLICTGNGLPSTSWLSGQQLAITQAFDGAGHLQSVTSSVSNPYPPSLYSLQQYNGVGPTNWNLGPNMSVTQGYTPRLWVNSISATGYVGP